MNFFWVLLYVAVLSGITDAETYVATRDVINAGLKSLGEAVGLNIDACINGMTSSIDDRNWIAIHLSHSSRLKTYLDLLYFQDIFGSVKLPPY